MTFSEVVDQVIALVRTRQRLSYRALKRELELTEEYLEDLKAELRYSHAHTIKEEGPGLVWVGEGGKGETEKRRNGEGEVVSSQHLAPHPQAATPLRIWPSASALSRPP